MFFDDKNKLSFGPQEEDQDVFAEKLQTLANFACGSFESDILGLKTEEEEPIEWMLSKANNSGSLKFSAEDKIRKAMKSLNKHKIDKDEILRKIAMKYNIEAEEQDDRSEISAGLYMSTEEDEHLLDENMIQSEKEKYYFGKKAKKNFWKLYKSDRVFKDNYKQQEEDIKDPRFAYLKAWHDMKMLPKAGMMIRDEKTTHLSFAHFGMLNKNTQAIAKSLKRYPLEIEGLDFTGNGLKAKEWILLVQSFEIHLATLQHLNFSENKIGSDGAAALSKSLPKMKLLESLNLEGNMLGDEAMVGILQGVSSLMNLKSINISNNTLGQKVFDSELISTLSSILKMTDSLKELDLSWNNLRGEAAENLILALKDNITVTKLNVGYNLFGVSTLGSSPAAIKFAEVFQENKVLEEVDLTSNFLDAKSAFCLAHGLRVNKSLKSFIVNGNPIGSAGIKFLLQSLNDNYQGHVKNLKMKETDTIIPSKAPIFDMMNVEGPYELELSNIYERVILFHLLDVDEKICHNSPEEEQMKQGELFIDAKLAGSSWVPPQEKDADGKWDLGFEPTGKLTFRFSLDPKRNQKPGPKDTELPKGTIVDSKSVIRPLISDEHFEK